MLERIGQPTELLGDAVGLEELPLSFGRSAAVAAHGRHDERLGAQALEMFDDRPGDDGDIGDAAAAGGDRPRSAPAELSCPSRSRASCARTSPGTSSTRGASNV